jgi:hypothetical protein
MHIETFMPANCENPGAASAKRGRGRRQKPGSFAIVNKNSSFSTTYHFSSFF